MMAIGFVLVLLAGGIGGVLNEERPAGWLFLVGIILILFSFVRWLWLVMP